MSTAKHCREPEPGEIVNVHPALIEMLPVSSGAKPAAKIMLRVESVVQSPMLGRAVECVVFSNNSFTHKGVKYKKNELRGLKMTFAITSLA